jgi:hypothetical protein
MTQKAGFIYFVRCGEFVKIGFSTWPEYRMQFLAVYNPIPCTLIASFPGTYQDEARVHRYARQFKHRGEWFRWCPEIAALVERGLPSLDELCTTDLQPWPEAELTIQGGAA